MPNRVKADEMPPKMKYFVAASAPFMSFLRKATRAYEDRLVISMPM